MMPNASSWTLAASVTLVCAPMAAIAQTASLDGGAHTDAIEQWRPEIQRASSRFNIPQNWIAAVMFTESRGQTHLKGKPITSPKGAMGLMQLMPDTYAEMRSAYDLGPDPYAPADNILAGAAYLKLNYERFGYPGLFAAYNAGPERYARSLTGATLPSETKAYLTSVLRNTGLLPNSPPSVFVPLDATPEVPESSRQPGLFIPLSE